MGGAYRTLTAGLLHSPREYAHLFFGVGWENFGPFYLAHRLPIASEEIRDPHNFIVRAFVELGLVGGVLMLAWIGRLTWELTRPVVPAGPMLDATSVPDGRQRFAVRMSRRRPALLAIMTIATVAMALNIAISLDFGADGWFVFLEIARRLMFLCVIMIGLSVAALRIPTDRDARDADEVDFCLDQRPAPWMLYAILAARDVPGA